MGSALAPEWCDRYVSLGIELGIPVLLTGTLGAYGPNNHLAGDATAACAPTPARPRIGLRALPGSWLE